MKRKINILAITAVVTVIVFVISTKMQKSLINYVPSTKCLVLSTNIKENQKLEKEMFLTADVPINLVANARIVQDFSEIEGLYANSDIYKSQIAMRAQFDTKENLSIYETEYRKRKDFY